MPDMNSVSMMERTFSMQLDFLKAIRSLIAYDKEHSQEPEKTRFLEAFCDTQEKALNMAVLLLNKHKDTLLDEEKAQKEAKQKAEEAKRAKDRECKIVCVNRYCMNLLYAPYWGKQR